MIAICCQATPLMSAQLTPNTIYELTAKDDKTIFLDEKPPETELNFSLREYDKVYLNADNYTTQEIQKVFSSNRKIHLILTDNVYSRWNIGRLMTRGKDRILIFSEKWGSWDVRRVAEQRSRIYIDGSRFTYWDLQKIIEAGGYVIIDADQLSEKELHQLTSTESASKVIVTFKDKQNSLIESLKKRGAHAVIENDLERLDLGPKPRAPTQKIIEEPPKKEAQPFNEMFNEWIEAAGSRKD